MANNQEIERRRTFAIIAHPDAGKTSLTEKLLLFGGQIQVAGAEQDKEDRHVRLDGHREAARHLRYHFRHGV